MTVNRKKTLLAGACAITPAVLAIAAPLLLASSLPAEAVGPIQASVVYSAKYNTYGATILALTPAASATDFFTVTGSAAHTIVIRNVSCVGVSTAAASIPVQLVLRSTANTGGTSTAPTMSPMDSSDPAATAVVAAYTANPTLGTLIGSVDVAMLSTGPATAAAGSPASFAWSPDDVREPPTLRGVTQVMALNANATSFAAGTSLVCRVIWTEQ